MFLNIQLKDEIYRLYEVNRCGFIKIFIFFNTFIHHKKTQTTNINDT